jgi:hypothetical protein
MDDEQVVWLDDRHHLQVCPRSSGPFRTSRSRTSSSAGIRVGSLCSMTCNARALPMRCRLAAE